MANFLKKRLGIVADSALNQSFRGRPAHTTFDIMVRACLCLLAGAMALQLSSFPPGYDLIATVLVALIVCWRVVCRTDLLMLLAGGLLFWIASTAIVDARLDRAFEGDSMLADIRITDFPSRDGAYVTFLASPIDDRRVPARLRLGWHSPPVRPRIGDIWRLELRLRRPRGASNPGSMDVEAWLHREKVLATGYVVSGDHTRLVDSGAENRIDRVRSSYAERVRGLLGDSESAGILLAVGIGARHQLTAEQWQRFAATGSSHLIAISGLHVGLAAVSAYALAVLVFGLLGIRRLRPVALLAAIMVASIYAALSGFAVPARRAILMLVIVTVALLRHRELDAMRALAATAIIVVATDPVSTMQPGFRLSFAAVAALIWQSRCCLASRIGTLAAVQVTLFFALLPLVALQFDRISFAAPFVNLVAVPIFSVVTVPATLLSVALPGVAGGWSLILAAASVDVVAAIVSLVADWPTAAVDLPQLRGPALAMFAVPLLWLLPAGWPARGIAVLGVAAIVSWRPPSVPEDCLDMTTLDTGHGLSIALQTSAGTTLYDTGASFDGGGSVAQRTIIPWLQSRAVSRLDDLIVSHADDDHAGGVGDIVARFAPDRVLSGEPLAGTPTTACRPSIAWARGGVGFRVLHPATAMPSGNDASCVVQVSIGDQHVLLTGDIESAAEAQLVRSRVLTNVAVVSVPHHGSRTSSSRPFVQSTRPQIAIVSASYRNHWGFPKPDVVARWRAAGARVMNTADSGAIQVRVCRDGGIVEVREWRKRKRRIWHDPDS